MPIKFAAAKSAVSLCRTKHEFVNKVIFLVWAVSDQNDEILFLCSYGIYVIYTYRSSVLHSTKTLREYANIDKFENEQGMEILNGPSFKILMHVLNYFS